MDSKLLTACFTVLKILSRKYPHSVEIKQYLDKKSKLNEVTATHITHYLLSIISSNKALELLPWPVSCSKTRAQYRIGVKKFIIWMNKEWPEAQIGFVPSLLTNPLSERKLLRFLLKLSLFTFKIITRRDDLEAGFTIPELTPDCEYSERLLIYQNKATSRISSFYTARTELDKQLQSKKKELRKLKKRNDFLKNNLENEINAVISLCPVKFQTRLVSNDNDWKSAIIEWTQEIDELSEINESKRKIVEGLFNSFCNLNTIKINFNNDDRILDAEEILSLYDKKIFEHFATKNKISLFEDRKLSLPGLLEVFKLGAKDILTFFENKPSLNNILETIQDDISQNLNDLNTLNTFFTDYYKELCNLESKIRPKYNDLVQQIVSDQEQLSSRKLSNFFESPLILILQDSINESPEFTSPGISGEQLLEETKKKFEKFSLDESENDSVESGIGGTPVSRKSSQMSNHSKNEKGYKLLNEGKNKSFASKIEKKRLSSLAVSLLQKQTWADNNLSLHSNVSYRKEVLSSTMRSESSKKNLRVPVESSVDESLSPIAGNSALRQTVNIGNIGRKNLNTDESSVDNFFSPLMSGRHSLSIKNTELLTSDLEKKSSRRSLGSSVKKILSPIMGNGGSVLKTIKDESLIIDSDEDSESSPQLFKIPVSIPDSPESKIKPRPSIQIIIDKYINLRKKMKLEDADL